MSNPTQHEAVGRVSELKSCPFCGGQNVYVEPDERGSGGQWVGPVHVGCKDCGVDMATEDYIDDAIAAWNLRAQSAGQSGVVVKPLDTAPSGADAMEPSEIDVHEGAWALIIGTNGKPAGWIDTHELFAHQLYRDQILPISTPPKPSLFGDALAAAGQSIGMSVTRVHPASYHPAFAASLTRVKDQLEARPEALRGPFKVDGLAPYVHPEPEKVGEADEAALLRLTAKGDALLGWIEEPLKAAADVRAWEDEKQRAFRLALSHATPPAADARRVEELERALRESQDLLVAMLHEQRPAPEIEAQIAANRAALKGDSNGQ